MRTFLPVIGGLTLVSALMVGVATEGNAATSAPNDPVIVVSPGHPHGWHNLTNKEPGGPYTEASSDPSSTASWDFREGPGQPPLGEGSLELATGSAFSSRVAAIPTGLIGEPVNTLTQLSYDTFLTHPGLEEKAPISFKIGIHAAALGGRFSTLVFEPARQPSQAPVLGHWQTWNALAGLWWASHVTGLCSQAHRCSWTQLESVVGGNSQILIPYFELGASGAAQVGTICAIDRVVINDPTYDFELEQPAAPGETPGPGESPEPGETPGTGEFPGAGEAPGVPVTG